MGDIAFFLVIAHVQQAGVEPNVKYVSRYIITRTIKNMYNT